MNMTDEPLMKALFADRREAGEKLGRKLLSLGLNNPLVLGLPRGGVVVAHETARILGAPLDVVIVKKIGAPGNPELGIGAVAEGHRVILDRPMVKALAITKEEVAQEVERGHKEVDRRQAVYRGGRARQVQNQTVILVDDGVATGVTATAAIEAVKQQQPKEIIFAAPVCAYETAESLCKKVDQCICLIKPHNLEAIGMYYEDFTQVSDEEVIALLKL